MDNIIYIVFFSIFAILLLIVGYIIYDYYNFKDDMEENIDSNMNAVNKFKNNYENYKNVFIKLSGLVRSNQEKTKSLVDETNRTKQIIDDINAKQESKLKEIDTLLKTYDTKLREFKNTYKQQKSSYMPFNNEAEILQELKTTEKNLYKHVNNFVLTKKEIYKIFKMFQELDNEHNQTIVGLATETIQINTILLTLLEYNNEVHTMIEHNWDKFDDIRSTIKEPDLTLVGEQLETNTSNITDLLTKFAQNRHEIEVLKQGFNYTRGILTYIDEEMIDILQATQDVLTRMVDLESQATTFQTRLNTLESEHDTIRNALVEMGIDIDVLENRLLILEQRNTDIGPLLDAIASSIESNQTNLTSADERRTNMRQTLTTIQETATNVERDIEEIEEDRGNIDISGFDRALKYAFGFKEGGQEINNTLYTNAFSGQSKDLELKRKTNMNNGLTIKTSGQNPLKVCEDGTNDCVEFNVNENDFSLITHNDVNNFMVKGQQNQMANFDLANNNIFMGGIDDNAIMTIKDGKIVFQNLVLNGKAYCKEEEIPPPVVAPPVIAPPTTYPISVDPNAIKDIAYFGRSTYFLTFCGDVYVCGSTRMHHPDNFIIDYGHIPRHLFIPEKIKSINVVYRGICFISIVGNVYYQGGKLTIDGTDFFENIVPIPTLIKNITNVVQVIDIIPASNNNSISFLKKDGTISNSKINTHTSNNLFVKSSNDKSSEYPKVLLSTKGEIHILRTYRENEYFYNKMTFNKIIQTKDNMLLDSDGFVFVNTNINQNPNSFLLRNSTRIKKILSNGFMISIDNSIYFTNVNASGGLTPISNKMKERLNINNDDILDIKRNHIITKNGKIYASGLNDYGQLGLPIQNPGKGDKFNVYENYEEVVFERKPCNFVENGDLKAPILKTNYVISPEIDDTILYTINNDIYVNISGNLQKNKETIASSVKQIVVYDNTEYLINNNETQIRQYVTGTYSSGVKHPSITKLVLYKNGEVFFRGHFDYDGGYANQNKSDISINNKGFEELDIQKISNNDASFKYSPSIKIVQVLLAAGFGLLLSSFGDIIFIVFNTQSMRKPLWTKDDRSRAKKLISNSGNNVYDFAYIGLDDKVYVVHRAKTFLSYDFSAHMTAINSNKTQHLHTIDFEAETNIKNAVKFSFSYFNIGVITSDKKCYTYGTNYYGQLGHSDATGDSQLIDFKQVNIENKPIKDVSVAGSYSVFITDDNKVYISGKHNGTEYGSTPVLY